MLSRHVENDYSQLNWSGQPPRPEATSRVTPAWWVFRNSASNAGSKPPGRTLVASRVFDPEYVAPSIVTATHFDRNHRIWREPGVQARLTIVLDAPKVGGEDCARGETSNPEENAGEDLERRSH
jgi:hypothetical protein